MSVRNFISKISNFLDQQTGFTMLDRMVLNITFWGLIVLYIFFAIEFFNISV